MRSPLARIHGVLRDIRYHSRRVERNRFDRVQGAGFVLFAFMAPLVVWRMEDLRVRESRETLQWIRAYDPIDEFGRSEGVRAIEIEEKDTDGAWPRSTPLATAEVIERTTWRGWPLVTKDTVHAPKTVLSTLPACTGVRRAEVERAVQRLVDKSAPRHGDRAADAQGQDARADRTRTHIASWIFSSGAWWVLLSLGLAVALAPLRLGWFLYRRGRNAVRQGRIDRCHCPNCGYNAKYSILRGRCPECGSELYERPDW